MSQLMEYAHVVLGTSSVWKRLKNSKIFTWFYGFNYAGLMFQWYSETQCPLPVKRDKILTKFKEQRKKRTRWILGFLYDHKVFKGHITKSKRDIYYHPTNILMMIIIITIKTCWQRIFCWLSLAIHHYQSLLLTSPLMKFLLVCHH